MGIGAYIKEIGRGKESARALSREQAADLMGQILDGKVSDLELGAFCIAMRVKGETPQEMAGFVDAVHARIHKVSSKDAPLVVIPSYNGARKMPVLTPLLALKLAQHGVGVIVHSNQTEAKRVSAMSVLAHLDVWAQAQFEPPSAGQVAVVHTSQLHKGLDRLLRVRETLALRNSGHSLVKLLAPTHTPSLLVTSYTHPEYLRSMTETLQLVGQPALLLRATEGEPVAHPLRCPAMDLIRDGTPRRLQEQTKGTVTDLPDLPDIDPVATASYTKRVLAGELPLPAPMAQQIQHILRQIPS
jgi:anthranilate phosphoribosyltransferase